MTAYLKGNGDSYMNDLRSKVRIIRQRNSKLLEQEKQRILDELTRMGAEKIILFGSLARNDCGIQSDLDLLVVMESQEDFLTRVAEIYRAIKPLVAADILVYTPEEFARLKENNPFIKKIIETGVPLHAQKT